jgi:hypothetical protein
LERFSCSLEEKIDEFQSLKISNAFSVTNWNAYHVLSQFAKKNAAMDDIRSAMDRVYVEINIFISSISQITQEFKNTFVNLNKVAESAGDRSNKRDIHMLMINL